MFLYLAYVWVVLSIPAALVLGAVIRNRDEQVPVETATEPIYIPQEWSA